MALSNQIETVEDLQGPAGRLEALLNVGSPDAPFSALVCHPHPPSGGTMHTKVVYQAMKTFHSFGLPVLRFNFRGIGKSAGSYSDGPGEILDVKAAIDWLDHRFSTPILLAGFSFGANIGIRAACGDTRVKGVVGLGLPVESNGRSYSYEFLSNCTQPKLFVIGSEDPFAPHSAIEHIVETAPAPKQLVWVPGAEHFFMGTPSSPTSKLPVMQAALRRWVEETFRLKAAG